MDTCLPISFPVLTYLLILIAQYTLNMNVANSFEIMQIGIGNLKRIGCNVFVSCNYWPLLYQIETYAHIPSIFPHYTSMLVNQIHKLLLCSAAIAFEVTCFPVFDFIR